MALLSSFSEWNDLAHEHVVHGNYDNTVNGKCCGCGDCCSNRLPLSQKEINQIKVYIKEHGITEQKHSCNVLMKKTIDMTCPFLDTTKDLKCTIYPVRPQICREYICNMGKRFMPSKAVLDGKHHNVFVRETFFKED